MNTNLTPDQKLVVIIEWVISITLGVLLGNMLWEVILWLTS